MALSGLSSIARLQSLTQVLGAGGDSFRKQVPRLSNITAELEFNVMASVNSPTALSHSSCGDTHVKTLSPRRRPAWPHSSSRRSSPSPGQSSPSCSSLPPREFHQDFFLFFFSFLFLQNKSVQYRLPLNYYGYGVILGILRCATRCMDKKQIFPFFLVVLVLFS